MSTYPLDNAAEQAAQRFATFESPLPEQEMVIRVTHIYRRVDDGWKLIHRHADFPPADERQRSSCRCERSTRG